MNIACIGAGYVGSVTGTAFAALGYKTTIIDIDPAKVEDLTNGRSPIYEPGLEQLIAQTVGKTLFASTSYDSVRHSDIVFIGVGTPSKENGNVDLTYIELAAQKIAKHLNPFQFTVIVNKSTVPVGTTDLVASIIEEYSTLKHNEHFAIVSNPEFLREGYAVEDVFYPDRVVVGSHNQLASDMMRELYTSIVARKNYEVLSAVLNIRDKEMTPLPTYYETDIRSAEMIKYASNAFLAVKISYINEVARLSDALGANALDVAKGMGMDSRIGDKFLEVSCGWSGSCFPKDTAEFLYTSQGENQELSIVKSAIASNKEMHRYCVDKVERALGSLQGRKIGILGLTFKPNTDDARNTQASYIIEKLIERGATIQAHDPQGAKMFRNLNEHLKVGYCASGQEVFDQADGVVLLTHWEEYKYLNWELTMAQMNHPYLLDTRNFLRELNLSALGYRYEGVGTSTEHRVSPSPQTVSL